MREIQVIRAYIVMFQTCGTKSGTKNIPSLLKFDHNLKCNVVFDAILLDKVLCL